MTEISQPLFDAATHPTLDGRWLRKELSTSGQAHWSSVESPRPNTFESVTSELQESGVAWALAMGMQGVGSYDEVRYIDAVRSSSSRVKLLPIAFVPTEVLTGRKSAAAWVETVAGLGYSGVKIHPRIARVSLQCSSVTELVAAASELQMPILICTYFASPSLNPARESAALWDLLQSNLNAKVVLLHGGLSQVLEFASMVKVLPNVVLDLSYTLCKFASSAVDLDLKFLAQTFDQRLCVGSDSPEFSVRQFRERFEWLTEGITAEQKSNIGYGNLLKFFNVD